MNEINADPRGLSLGATVRRGWTLVGLFRCQCGRHTQEPFVAVWKKEGSKAYLLQRPLTGGGFYEHLIHPLHAKYNPDDWQTEMGIVWNDMAGHPVEREVMPRPKGVRWR